MLHNAPPKVKRTSSVGRAASGVQASPAEQKARLVDVGLYALCRGEWDIAMAITSIIQGRYRHD